MQIACEKIYILKLKNILKQLWEPKFTPSISVIGGKSGNSNFPLDFGFSARANDKWPNKYGKYEKTTNRIYRKGRSYFESV